MTLKISTATESVYVVARFHSDSNDCIVTIIYLYGTVMLTVEILRNSRHCFTLYYHNCMLVALLLLL